MTKLTIIDYGLGNLFSVSRAFEHVGAEIELTADISKIKSATHLLLPGVGAFSKGMEELTKRGLVAPIKEYAANGGKLLGICLGMQMLFDGSEENGKHTGLGIIPGMVKKIPATGTNGEALKIPHIGWTKLTKDQPSPMLADMPEDNSFYFVHSYHAVCNPDNLAAHAIYGGNKITACVRSGNVFGCQFHPEKSASTGLRICKNFMES